MANATPDALEPVREGPLAGIRVLDLTTERAELAGRMLADLGADVLKIEPPEGARARHLAPFDERSGAPSDGDHPRSLYWAAVGLGKRSLVLDLDTADDRDHLVELATAADVLLESFGPGFLDDRELGDGALRARNPRLIYASITPFGAAGPKAHWPASELTIEAACGRLSLQGDRDRPPLPLGYPQAAFHAGALAAGDIVIALNEREASGLGQRLDTSMTEAMIWTLMNGTQYPPATGHDPPAGGDDRATSDFRGAGEGPPIPCADGWVNAAFPPPLLGQLLVAIRDELGDAFAAELDVPPELATVDADQWADDVMSERVAPELIAAALEVVLRFIAARPEGGPLRVGGEPPHSARPDQLHGGRARRAALPRPRLLAGPSATPRIPVRPPASRAPRSSNRSLLRSSTMPPRTRTGGPRPGPSPPLPPPRTHGSGRPSPASRSPTSPGSRPVQ